MALVSARGLVKQLARPVLRVAGLPLARVLASLLRRSNRRAGVALVYHSLALRGGDPATELVAPHEAGLFDAEMRHVARTYRVVPASQLLHAAATRRRGERFPLAVTFDDDLASHLTLALPILRRCGVTATFFLTGASLHGPSSFWWERLQRVVDKDPGRLAQLYALVGGETPSRTASTLHELGRRVEQLEPGARDAFAETLAGLDDDAPDDGVSADGLEELVGTGMEIGFHTRRHHPLPTLDEPSLAAAFEEGRAELEQLIGRRLSVVGYPHGRADERVAAAAERASFETGYTGIVKRVAPGDDPLLLGRVNPSYRSVGHFALQIVVALLRR